MTILGIPTVGLQFQNRAYSVLGDAVAQPFIPSPRGGATDPLEFGPDGMLVSENGVRGMDPPLIIPLCIAPAILTPIRDQWNTQQVLFISRAKYDTVYNGAPPPENKFDYLFTWQDGNGDPENSATAVQSFYGIFDGNVDFIDRYHNSVFSNEFSIPGPPENTVVGIDAATSVLIDDDVVQIAQYYDGANLYQSVNGGAVLTTALPLSPVIVGDAVGDYGIYFSTDDFLFLKNRKWQQWFGVWPDTIDPAIDLPAFSDPSFTPTFPPGLTNRGQQILGAMGS